MTPIVGHTGVEKVSNLGFFSTFRNPDVRSEWKERETREERTKEHSLLVHLSKDTGRLVSFLGLPFCQSKTKTLYTMEAPNYRPTYVGKRRSS